MEWIDWIIRNCTGWNIFGHYQNDVILGTNSYGSLQIHVPSFWVNFENDKKYFQIQTHPLSTHSPTAREPKTAAQAINMIIASFIMVHIQDSYPSIYPYYIKKNK